MSAVAARLAARRESRAQARRAIVGLLAGVCALGATAASAEIAVLSSGRTMKLSSHRTEAAGVVLLLPGGGEITVPQSEVLGFVPNEVADEVASIPAGADLPLLVEAVARRHGLDPRLVGAVVEVESAYRADTVSPKGARGLMQLMPGTAADLGVANPLDPEANVDGGVRYLVSLLDLYRGDVVKALAAYNAGPGAVARHKGVPPYRETRDYVRKVMRKYKGGEPEGGAKSGGAK